MVQQILGIKTCTSKGFTQLCTQAILFRMMLAVDPGCGRLTKMQREQCFTADSATDLDEIYMFSNSVDSNTVLPTKIVFEQRSLLKGVAASCDNA